MKKNVVMIAVLLAPLSLLRAADDIIVNDFESETYGAWKIEGTAFGSGPARETLPGQMKVEGFVGKGYVNSYHGGDGSTGTLTSPEFKIERKFINFLIGGGGWANETCLNLIVDGKVVRTATGPNTDPGGEERLEPGTWDISEFSGKPAVVQIVDQRSVGWGHLNVDQIVQSDTKTPGSVVLEKTLTVNGSHLLVPVGNAAIGNNPLTLRIYDGETIIQSFSVALPKDGEPYWMAAYPLEHFALKGKSIRITSERSGRAPASAQAAFEKIRVGSDKDVLLASDYTQPYRNQFHASSRRGWINDPNGMVYSNGKYHLYYQHNPFGIQWGNMHWGHLESTDLIHWEEKPIALYQRTTGDMAFSGNGFLDFNNSAGLGKGTQFAAYTSTGRGECLAYSKDGGLTFTDIPENPLIKHQGRDPFIIWYQPEQKWVMVVFSGEECDETKAVPSANTAKANHYNMAFYESKNLRQWTRTGAFTDPDRDAVYECPMMAKLPVVGKSGESRWILLGARNRYFIGRFDGKTFHKESGPHGTQHGAFYAAQTFSNVPDNRCIQIGWVLTDVYLEQFPDQVVNQAFTLPHELTLRETADGLRLFFWPVKETENLRGEVLAEGKDLTPSQANELLQKCQRELSEVLIEYADSGPKELVINSINASFNGSKARIFTDRTFNEIYADAGISYELRKLPPKGFESPVTKLTAPEGTVIRSLKIFRLKSIWNQK